MPKKTFDTEDLRRWQQKGLLSDEQLKLILAEEGLEAKPEEIMKAEPEEVLKAEPEEAEKKTGLNAVTVAYYFGGILAFLSFTFFVGMNWEDLSDWERFSVALGAILVTAVLGIWLRFIRSYHVAGGLLLFVTAAIVPLYIYTIAELAGIWPETPYSREPDYSFLYLSLISLPVALLILILTRFSLISLIVAGLVHFAASAAGEITNADQAVVTAATCGAFIILGLGLSLWGKKRHTFWFKLYGLVGLQIAFMILFIDSNNVSMGILYLCVYLIMIGFSLRFQEVIYLVFGAIGVYTYITKLVFDTFEGTAYFPLLLGVIGVSIIILAVLYQRYRDRLYRSKA